MRITIAGYGSIGQYVEEVFGRRHDTTAYDPPKGLGRQQDLTEADFVFLCVPTPSLPGGECDTSIVEELVSQVEVREAIVCQSTVAAGTIERLLRIYRKPLVYVPEYAGESPDHLYRRLENRNFFIYGGYEPAASRVRALFEDAYGAGRRHFVVPPAVAEIVKYMENSFLAMKVAFCNEFYDLCGAFGADYEAVRQLWLEDQRIAPSHTMVTAERGFGGTCLPKDVAAVCATARQAGVPLEIMEAVQRVNQRHRAAVNGHREAAVVPALRRVKVKQA